MKRRIALAAVAAAALSIPHDASAQYVGYRGIEGWVGYAAWTGDDAEAYEGGFRGGITVFSETSPRLGIGLAFLYGRFDIDLDEAGSVGASEWGAGLTARYALGDRAGTHPFVGGLVGWHRVAVDDLGFDLVQDGFEIGPEVGAEIVLRPGLYLVIAGGGSWQSYGNAHVFGSGLGVEGSSGSAIQYGARIGLHVGAPPTGS